MTATGKQSPQYASFGCVYTAHHGHLADGVAGAGAANVHRQPAPDPDLEGGRLIVEVTVGGNPTRGTLAARATLEGQPVGEAQNAFVGQQARLVLPLREMQTWAPGQPTLYDLELTLEAQNGSRDQVQSYFGMRSLALTDRAILLNGTPVYQRLVLDQGFYPDGLYTAPTDDALRNDIVISQGLGFNGARLHEKCSSRASCIGQTAWAIWCGASFPTGAWTSAARRRWPYASPMVGGVAAGLQPSSIVGGAPNETQRNQDPRVVHGIYQIAPSITPGQ